jgi:hypothetical protein
MKTPDCYDCKHRRDVPGNAHSKCVHPEARSLNVEGSPHGIRNGWFCFPYNFDPVWLNECDGFEKKE